MNHNNYTEERQVHFPKVSVDKLLWNFTVAMNKNNCHGK